MGAGKGPRGRPAAQNRQRAWCTRGSQGQWAMMRFYPHEVGGLRAKNGSLGRVSTYPEHGASAQSSRGILGGSGGRQASRSNKGGGGGKGASCGPSPECGARRARGS
jgi:hypothetical protein